MKRFLTISLKTCIAFTLIVLIGALASLAVFQTGQRNASLAAKAKVDDLRSRGVPTDHESVINDYRAIATSEKLDVWKRIFASMEHKKVEDYVPGIYKRFGEGDETYAQQDRQFLNKLSPLVNDIHLGLMDGMPVEFSPRIDTIKLENPYRKQLQCVAQLMFLEATDPSPENKDTNAILKSIAALLNLMGAVSADKSADGQLFQSAMAYYGLQATKQVIASNSLAEPDLEELQNILKAVPKRIIDWEKMVDSEYGLIIPLFQGNVVISERDGVVNRPTPRGKDFLHFMELMERYADVNFDECSSALNSINSIDSSWQSKSFTSNYISRDNWTYCSIAMPSFRSTALSLFQDVSDRNQAILATAIKLYQKKRGKFPESLDQLKDIDIDPTKYLSISNEAFGYCVEGSKSYLWAPEVIVKLGATEFKLDTQRPKIVADMSKDAAHKLKHLLWEIPE